MSEDLKLKIAWYGMWSGLNFDTCPLYGLFDSRFNVTTVPVHDDPDMVISSLFGGYTRPSFLKNKFVLQYVGEPASLFPKSMYWGDHILGFQPDGPNNTQFPQWLFSNTSYDTKRRKLHFNRTPRPLNPKTKFASILASHDKFGTREKIYDVISTYRSVDSLGAWRNNVPGDGLRHNEAQRVESKLSILDQYKFNLAIENTVTEPYYLTEKLHEALRANTIPIYYGADNLDQLPYNPNRFIYANKLSNNQLRQEVITLDTDKFKYDQMLAEPWFQREPLPGGFKRISDKIITAINNYKV